VTHQYRVTKYDPRKRDRWGAYPADDWIGQDQIGQTFGGVVLTAAEYQRVEDAYVAAAMAFVRESGGEALRVTTLENHGGHAEPGLRLVEGALLSGAGLERVCRLNLRGMLWCKLEDAAGGRFVHFGYDYYMYVGVPARCEGAIALARRLGLFVEDFASPHREESEEDPGRAAPGGEGLSPPEDREA